MVEVLGSSLGSLRTVGFQGSTWVHGLRFRVLGYLGFRVP